MKKICQQCGKQWNARRSRRSFCSLKCFNISVCGKTYEQRYGARANELRGLRSQDSKEFFTRMSLEEKNQWKTKIRNSTYSAMQRPEIREKHRIAMADLVTREKISKGNIGKIWSLEQRKNHSLFMLEHPVKYWLGKKRPESTIQKIKLSQKLHPYKWSERRRHEESIRMSGENNPNWISDRSKVIKNHRNDPEYKRWARLVKKRDNHTCQLKDRNCRGHNEVHHILDWKSYPQERYNINNGITLCQFHHPKKRVDEQRLVQMLQKLINTH